tara:strand:- start:87 stop:446 length:360 start_codon:yes stop_codon:yes gene_type:complete
MTHPFVKEGDYLVNANIIRFTENEKNSEKKEESVHYFENKMKSICTVKEITKKQAEQCGILWDKEAPYVWVLNSSKERHYFLYAFFFVIFVIICGDFLKDLSYFVIGLFSYIWEINFYF